GPAVRRQGTGCASCAVSVTLPPNDRPTPRRTKKIHRAGCAFVILIQPAFRLGIAPLPSDRSVEASTYSRALLGARGTYRVRGYQVNTSRQRFVAICAGSFSGRDPDAVLAPRERPTVEPAVAREHLEAGF